MDNNKLREELDKRLSYRLKYYKMHINIIRDCIKVDLYYKTPNGTKCVSFVLYCKELHTAEYLDDFCNHVYDYLFYTKDSPWLCRAKEDNNKLIMSQSGVDLESFSETVSELEQALRSLQVIFEDDISGNLKEHFDHDKNRKHTKQIKFGNSRRGGYNKYKDIKEIRK